MCALYICCVFPCVRVKLLRPCPCLVSTSTSLSVYMQYIVNQLPCCCCCECLCNFHASVRQFHDKLFGAYDFLEIGHGYIQWLFPIRERGVNPSAVPLTLVEAQEMSRDTEIRANIIASYKLMLDFYGIELIDEDSGAVQRSKRYKTRYENLMIKNHNWLRITRILKCLGEVGFEHYKSPLCEHFIREYLSGSLAGLEENTVFVYWAGTVRSDAERARLQAMSSR